MKSAKLLVLALFVPSLFLLAQDGKPAAADTSAPVDDTYIIGPTDSITINVWKETVLSNAVLVRPDGMISMPLLGDVQASGLTPLQLAAQITAKLKKYMQDPTVTVTVNGINSKKIYMLGEVGRKGPIELTPGMTLLQAIATAGGISQYANAKKIYILRLEAGVQEKIPVHYKKALKGDNSMNLALKAGDTIVVP